MTECPTWINTCSYCKHKVWGLVQLLRNVKDSSQHVREDFGLSSQQQDGSFRSEQHILIQNSKVAKGPLPSTALFLWPFKTLILQTVPLNPHGHDLFARLAGQWISLGSDTMEKEYGAGWWINHAVWYLNTKREPKSQANGRCTHLSTIALVTIFALKLQVSLAPRKGQRARYHVLMTC